MNAEPDVQLRLLDVQAIDAKLSQLAHRRRSLPELVTVADLTARQARVRDRVVAAQTEASDLERAQRKAELDVEQVRQRATRDQELLDSGRVGAAKELESLQREILSLARRQGELEDVELEIMQRLEDTRSVLAELTTELEQLTGELAQVSAARDAAFADIDGEASWAGSERARLLPGIGPDLIALYDKLRADHEGVGAAKLFQGRCEGCRIQLTPVDLARIRTSAPEAVLRCEECRRILVRTPESGLL